MSDNSKSSLSSLFDALAKLFAFVVLAAFIFQNLVGFGWFGDNTEVLTKIAEICTYVMTYAAIILAGLTALEFGTKHGLLLTIIVLAIVALALIPRFIPSVWEKILGAIGQAA